MTSGLWQISSELEELDPKIIKYGEGFLKSHPENWIPNFSSYWSPLLSLINFEVNIIDIQPTFELPTKNQVVWAGAFDNHKIGIACESLVAKYLASLFIPDIDQITSKVLEDYLARRLMRSLAASWTGPSLGEFKYIGLVGKANVASAAAVRMVCAINGRQLIFWFLLEEDLLHKLDNLWRRQTTTFNVRKIEAKKYELSFYRGEIEVEDLENILVVGHKIFLKDLNFNQITLQEKSSNNANLVKINQSAGNIVLRVVETGIEDDRDSRGLSLHITSPEFTLSPEQIQLGTRESFILTNLPIDMNLLVYVSNEIVAEACIQKDEQGYYAEIIS